MRLVVMMLAVGVVAGCQAPGAQLPPPYTRTQDLRCQMQARAATASIPNAFTAGFEQGTLTNQCRELAMRENMEAVGQRLGFRIREGQQLTKEQRTAVAGMAQGCGVAEAAALRSLATDMPGEWSRGETAGRAASEGECAFARMGVAVMTRNQPAATDR